jgi:hypothetical protein
MRSAVPSEGPLGSNSEENCALRHFRFYPRSGLTFDDA